jgi:hypothetical protein
MNALIMPCETLYLFTGLIKHQSRQKWIQIN